MNNVGATTLVVEACISARGLLTREERIDFGLPVPPERLRGDGFGERFPLVALATPDGAGDAGEEEELLCEGSNAPESVMAWSADEELLDDGLEIESEAASDTALAIAASRFPTGPTSIFNYNYC